jgi:hypothetical protein
VSKDYKRSGTLTPPASIIKNNKENMGKRNLDREFETYLLWRSLPSMIKKETPDILERLGMAEGELAELLQIKNQQDFCSKYKIGDDTTISRWNKRIEAEGLLSDKRMWWLKRLTSNVMMSLYKNILSDGDAARVKLWLQNVEGWMEKSEVEHSMNPLKSLIIRIQNEKQPLVKKPNKNTLGNNNAGTDGKEPERPRVEIKQSVLDQK